MNHLKILASALLVCVLHLSAVAQIPYMESRLDITTLGQPRSVAADGYGQHIVYETFGTVTHKLIGNDGAMISSHSNNLNVTDAYSPVVNAHNGKVYVAMINGARNLIKLRLSLDGGSSWIPLPNYEIESPAFVNNASIDAFTDDHGVHVVWSYPSLSYDTNNKVHYIRYSTQSSQWVAYKEVTDLNAQGGIRARVITSGNTAVVAFLHIAGPPPPPQSH